MGPHSRGLKKADLVVKDFRLAGIRDLIINVSLRHEFHGASADPACKWLCGCKSTGHRGRSAGVSRGYYTLAGGRAGTAGLTPAQIVQKSEAAREQGLTTQVSAPSLTQRIRVLQALYYCV